MPFQHALRLTPLVLGLSALAPLAGCGKGGSGTGGSGTTTTTTSTTATSSGNTSTTTTGKGATSSNTTTASTSTGGCMGTSSSTGGGTPPDFTCAGMNPATAPAMVTVSGSAFSIDAGGQTNQAMVPIEAFVNGSMTSLANTMSDSTALPGDNFKLTIPTTNMMPLDGYLVGHDNNTGKMFKDAYLYPPYPLAKDQGNGALVLLNDSTFGLLKLVTQQQQDTANKAFIVMAVVDCAGKAIAGATVATSPAGSGVCYYQGGANIDCSACATTNDQGFAFVFNVPPGNTTVSAMYNGMSLHSHSLEARVNAVTATALRP